jgi:hypothetical protein
MLVKEIVLENYRHLSELFKPGQEWKWNHQGYNEAVATFQVGDVPYEFHAYSEGNDEEWDVEFKRVGHDLDKPQKYGLTGTGRSAEVMSVVVDIMRSFIKEYKDDISVLRFTAKEGSRQGLYGKMINRLLPSWSLEQDGETFVLRAPNPYKKVKEAVDFEQMQPQQIIAVAQDAFAQRYPEAKLYGKSVVEGVGLTTHKGGEGSASAFAGSDTKRGAFYLTLNAYAEGSAMIVVIEDATAGEYKGAATAIIKALFEAGERLYKTEQRELVINDNANTEVWDTIADRVGAEIVG